MAPPDSHERTECWSFWRETGAAPNTTIKGHTPPPPPERGTVDPRDDGFRQHSVKRSPTRHLREVGYGSSCVPLCP